MDLLPYLGLAVLATILLVIIRPLRPEVATILSLAAGGIMLVSILGRLRALLGTIGAMAARAEIQPFFLQTVLKVIGLAYLAGFTAQICRDAGEGAIATKVEFVGKVAILLVGLPVVWAVLETMLKIF